MKVTVSFKDAEKHKPAEKEMAASIKKLETLLKSYSPDLVQLHAAFSRQPRKEEYEVSLNLTLPTGTLHATASSVHLRTGCKKAFSEIESQVKKHQSKLRKDYEWKRKRTRDKAVAVFS